jgi:hypothetical protein
MLIETTTAIITAAFVEVCEEFELVCVEVGMIKEDGGTAHNLPSNVPI